ncbi:hypothetical protein [Pedobacter nutrimenti]|jgi:hypothetical protein|uniref:Uncharacterized protein n=1 Tax=Pedobacter nutrimenti TaxID=1241337 RepID=A0A318UGY9_9SPHI|nr:hypothetical protein [Pedobacter nutrimenti]PYF74770.1 hypothetical protein B0O44_103216 [Pedobacter nutrimenti]
MKKPFLILALTTLSLSAFSQFQVGRSKEQIKTDETNAKPKRIGAKLTLLTPDYELYSLNDKEYLKYVTKGGMNTQIYETINFSSAKEEKDFYEYVLGLFDEFKDNEVTLSGVRIVPHPMKLLGINNIMFDVYKKGSTYKNETVMISKKAWIRLFEKSRIHSL